MSNAEDAKAMHANLVLDELARRDGLVASARGVQLAPRQQVLLAIALGALAIAAGRFNWFAWTIASPLLIQATLGVALLVAVAALIIAASTRQRLNAVVKILERSGALSKFTADAALGAKAT